ncbi:MAG: anaerobic ribonucleoside-triphosphate reductase activating protein [Thermoguttaceae bacterium]|jgi:pyruvate formate lyase activating enzyme|nr:anaerobic ribonucleoside-triphosphate reductase activating protein [Thermoguttaceae bacterium]
MLFGGFLPLTLVDFPGRVACVVFTQGCNLRCGYCHNPQLIDLHPSVRSERPTESQVLDFLKTRRRVLDGLVISGGEPTLQPDLIPFLNRIKNLGLLVKLDTNGTNPHVLREALERGLLDYLAMDVKDDPQRYARLAGVAVDPAVLVASRDLLLSSHVADEFRTTVIPRFHDESTIEEISRFCAGASRYVLQAFRSEEVFKPAFREYAPTAAEQLHRFKRVAERFVANVEVRC